MARGITEDRLQNFRYRLVTDATSGLNFEAGFNSITVPEITLEAAEYREGTYTFTRKQPGIPTVSDCTLSQGVTRNGTPFYDLIKRSLGIVDDPAAQPYRIDVTIYHYHILDDMGDEGGTLLGDASQKIKLINAFAIRAKPSGDLDATASDISLRECDLAVEEVQVTNLAPA